MSGIEVAIIGAGPAGSTLGASLARRGRRVALFEKDVFPRDKLCGEFLSTESTRCLEELGCFEAFMALEPALMTRARLVSASGHNLILALPGAALGLSRKKLDSFLFEYARRCGAEVFEGADVRRIELGGGGKKQLVVRHGCGREEVVEADLVVAAYGRRTRLDRQLERPFFDERSPYVAFKKHHRLVDGEALPALDKVVELYAFDGGYCGVSYVEEGLVNVCTMVDVRHVEAMEGADWPEVQAMLSGQHPALAARLASLTPCESETLAVAQIPLSLKESSREDMLFVGDAAGMIAPLAGDGQAMAMESGLALAKLLDEHLPEIPYAQWSKIWRAQYERRVRLGQWLQRAMIQPQISTMAMGLLTRWPRAGQALVGWTRG